MRNFRSDNNSGLCPEALAAFIAAAKEHTIAYGADEYTAQAVKEFRTIFGEATQVYFVATGTAANALAIASLTEPWQRVMCHEYAHLAVDESTAPERFSGCRLISIPTRDSKLRPEALRRWDNASTRDHHQPQPGVVSITNPTEFGQVYTPEETRTLADTAHELGYRFHVDGARFANAVAHLRCEPRAITVDAGVDALTFGGTKNGLASGEAVLFFPQGDGAAAARAAERFSWLRKSGGHLVSKHRFITAPFAAVLETGAWLNHAANANAAAEVAASILERAGHPPTYPRESNGLFTALPKEVHEALSKKNFIYYHVGTGNHRAARFMMNFDTPIEAAEELGQAIVTAWK